jgi:hypothetical protein
MLRDARKGPKAPTVDRQHWRTPPGVLAWVRREIGPIVLDAAAHSGNAVAPAWLGPGGLIESALDVSDWSELGPHLPRHPPHDDGPQGTIFVNPPFSSLPMFVDVAIETARVDDTRTIVMLAPLSPDTRWAHRLFAVEADCIMLRGRVRYLPPRAMCDCGADSDVGRQHATTCPYRSAARHGPSFPSALWVLASWTGRFGAAREVSAFALDAAEFVAPLEVDL